MGFVTHTGAKFKHYPLAPSNCPLGALPLLVARALAASSFWKVHFELLTGVSETIMPNGGHRGDLYF